MLEVITAQVPGQCQIFFNISKAVGVGCPNDPIDVELVQLGYLMASLNPLNSAPPEAKAIWKQIRPGEKYTGSPTDLLTKAIEADERRRGVKVDGHVSRMHGGVGKGLRYIGPRGSEPFLLVGLCNNISDMMPDNYPRIDQAPECPSRLATHIKKLFQN